MSAYRCAVASAARGEPMLATASGIVRWLLVEQPGPWQEAAPPPGRMNPRAFAHCRAAATAAGARMLTIRRPGRDQSAEARTIMLVESRIGLERLLERQVGWDDDFADLELPAATGGPTAGWSPARGPLLLVCTHGQHDVCCALQGRPLAAALAERMPDLVWECSHVGGDRFAGNLVVLPRGHFFGRVDARAAVQVAESYLAGQLSVEYLRGRSSLTMPAQAAQQFALVQAGLDGVDDLPPLGVTVLDADTWRVQLALPGGADAGSVGVTVRRSTEADAALLTCHAPQAQHPPAYQLVELVGHGDNDWPGRPGSR